MINWPLDNLMMRHHIQEQWVALLQGSRAGALSAPSNLKFEKVPKESFCLMFWIYKAGWVRCDIADAIVRNHFLCKLPSPPTQERTRSAMNESVRDAPKPRLIAWSKTLDSCDEPREGSKYGDYVVWSISDWNGPNPYQRRLRLHHRRRHSVKRLGGSRNIGASIPN